jgi:hypothetical protein
MVGVIYRITNLLNSKIYIGSDTKNGGKGDPAYMGSGILIKKAIKKYGIANFKKEILFQCSSSDELKTKETGCIREHRSFDRSIGYNISDGYWGGNTLTNHPDIEKIKKKISNNTIINSFKITEGRKKFYLNETSEEREKRINNIKKGMEKADKSFFHSDVYRKNLSEGIKNSEKFQDYNKKRSGSKRGKYSVNWDSYAEKRKEEISKISSEKLKCILEGLLDKDHSTFFCYLKVYLHLEDKEKIEGLDDFMGYLEENLYSSNVNHIDIRKKYKEIGLGNKKLGKSTTVLKSLYSFQIKNYTNIIINPVKRF